MGNYCVFSELRESYDGEFGGKVLLDYICADRRGSVLIMRGAISIIAGGVGKASSNKALLS